MTTRKTTRKPKAQPQAQPLWQSKSVFMAMAIVTVASMVSACTSLYKISEMEINNANRLPAKELPFEPIITTQPDQPVINTERPRTVERETPVQPTIEVIGDKITLECERYKADQSKLICEEKKNWNPFAGR